jgi:hypothetical protein
MEVSRLNDDDLSSLPTSKWTHYHASPAMQDEPLDTQLEVAARAAKAALSIGRAVYEPDILGAVHQRVVMGAEHGVLVEGLPTLAALSRTAASGASAHTQPVSPLPFLDPNAVATISPVPTPKQPPLSQRKAAAASNASPSLGKGKQRRTKAASSEQSSK